MPQLDFFTFFSLSYFIYFIISLTFLNIIGIILPFWSFTIKSNIKINIYKLINFFFINLNFIKILNKKKLFFFFIV